MRRATRIVAALLLAAVSSFGAVPQYEISVDTQYPERKWDLNPVYAGATPLIRCNLSTNSGAWTPSADWGSFFLY